MEELNSEVVEEVASVETELFSPAETEPVVADAEPIAVEEPIAEEETPAPAPTKKSKKVSEPAPEPQPEPVSVKVTPPQNTGGIAVARSNKHN